MDKRLIYGLGIGAAAVALYLYLRKKPAAASVVASKPVTSTIPVAKPSSKPVPAPAPAPARVAPVEPDMPPRKPLVNPIDLGYDDDLRNPSVMDLRQPYVQNNYGFYNDRIMGINIDDRLNPNVFIREQISYTY